MLICVAFFTTYGYVADIQIKRKSKKQTNKQTNKQTYTVGTVPKSKSWMGGR